VAAQALAIFTVSGRPLPEVVEERLRARLAADVLLRSAVARAYYQCALAILTARLGAEHPHMQTVRRTLVRRDLAALADAPAD
jgi:hypothetical protein